MDWLATSPGDIKLGSLSDQRIVRNCFGNAALARTTAEHLVLQDRYGVPVISTVRQHAQGVFDALLEGSGMVSALFDQAGAELFCPYLDSRMVRLAVVLAWGPGRHRDLLRHALARHTLPELAERPRIDFEPPLQSWLAPGGRLAPLIEHIGTHDFVEARTFRQARTQPSGFLYRLLCYDLWHKLFVERSLPRTLPRTPAWRQQVVALAAG
jgi:hypothetical protein